MVASTSLMIAVGCATTDLTQERQSFTRFQVCCHLVEKVGNRKVQVCNSFLFGAFSKLAVVSRLLAKIVGPGGATGYPFRAVYQLWTGLACQSSWFPDGRRAIVDIFVPGNVVGLETMLSLRSGGTVTAAGPVRCRALDSQRPQQLMQDREVALCFTSVLVESRRRSEEPTSRIARLVGAAGCNPDQSQPRVSTSDLAAKFRQINNLDTVASGTILICRHCIPLTGDHAAEALRRCAIGGGTPTIS